MRFSWVKDGFVNLVNNPKSLRRAKLAYYIVPVTLVFAVQIKNYLTTSYIVYLKYQAMVDEYSDRKVAQRQVEKVKPSLATH